MKKKFMYICSALVFLASVFSAQPLEGAAQNQKKQVTSTHKKACKCAHKKKAVKKVVTHNKKHVKPVVKKNVVKKAAAKKPVTKKPVVTVGKKNAGATLYNDSDINVYIEWRVNESEGNKDKNRSPKAEPGLLAPKESDSAKGEATVMVYFPIFGEYYLVKDLDIEKGKKMSVTDVLLKGNYYTVTEKWWG